MLEFTGPSSFTSTVRVYADTFSCRANVNAHTHIMPAYVPKHKIPRYGLCPLYHLHLLLYQIQYYFLNQRVQTKSINCVKYRKDGMNYYSQGYCVKSAESSRVFTAE